MERKVRYEDRRKQCGKKQSGKCTDIAERSTFLQVLLAYFCDDAIIVTHLL